MFIKKQGKKAKEWIKAKRKLLNELKKTGEYNVIGTKVFGLCKDCGHYQQLTPDHKIRRSQGGSHERSNIDFICLNCHMKRDQQGDPNKKKPTNKKPAYGKPHACKNCKNITSMLLCHHCKNISI